MSAGRFRTCHRGRRLRDRGAGGLRLPGAAAGLARGSRPCLGVHRRWIPRSPHRLPARGPDRSDLAPCHPVVRTRLRRSASRRLPRGVLHPARSWPRRRIARRRATHPRLSQPRHSRDRARCVRRTAAGVLGAREVPEGAQPSTDSRELQSLANAGRARNAAGRLKRSRSVAAIRSAGHAADEVKAPR